MGDRLRKAREQAGLDQRELAERAHIARGTVSAAENGRRMPSPATLSMWAIATGVTREWLVGDSVPPARAQVALEEIRMTAMLAVIRAAARPEMAGSAEAATVLDAISVRESAVQSAGAWESSSKIHHPELLTWCHEFQPWTAEELEAASLRVLASEPGGKREP